MAPIKVADMLDMNLMLDNKFHMLKMQTTRMLNEAPKSNVDATVNFWKTLKPMNTALFGKYYLKACPGSSLFGDEMVFDSGEIANCYSWEGTKHTLSGKLHGIARKVLNSGTILEATFFQGKRSGLMRQITRNEVSIFFYKDDEYIAHYEFTADF